MSSDDQTKQYGGYLCINWRNDEVRYRKTKPKSGRSSPHELAIPLEIAVTVPSIDVPRIEADITVPPAQVEQAVTHELEEAETDEERDERR